MIKIQVPGDGKEKGKEGTGGNNQVHEEREAPSIFLKQKKWHVLHREFHCVGVGF